MERIVRKGENWAIESVPGVTSRTTWSTEAEAEQALAEMLAARNQKPSKRYRR